MAVVNRNTYQATKTRAAQASTARRAADQEILSERARLLQLERDEKELRRDSAHMIERELNEASSILQDDLDALREEFGQQLGKQAVATKKMLDDVRRLANLNSKELDEVNQQIASLEKRLDGDLKRIVAQIDTAKKQAVCFYDQLSGIVGQIAKLSPEKYEVLFPDILQPGYMILKTSLGTIQDDINQGYYEAAIGVAQTRLPEAVHMLGHLEFYDASYRRIYKKASSLLGKLNSQLNAMRATNVRTVVFGDEVEYEDSHGADYWARELFDIISGSIESFNKRLNEYSKVLDIDAIEKLWAEMQGGERQCAACIAISDQERQLHFECVEKVAQASDILLANDSNWTFKAWNINSDDMRDPASAVLTSPEGYSIVIICSPERSIAGQAGSVRMEIDAFDCGMSKEDLGRCKVICESVTSVLHANGMLRGEQAIPNACTTDSQSFIRRATIDENTSRVKWLNKAKATLGL